MAAGTLLVYDYILTFPKEVDLVWRAKWTIGKSLFLLLRYGAWVDVVIFTYGHVVQETSPVSCHWAMYGALCSAPLMYLLGCLVLALRTWAIWNRTSVCGALLAIAWIANAGLTLYITAEVGRLSVTTSPPYPGGTSFDPPGCGPIVTSEGMAKLFVWQTGLAIYELVIFILTIARGIRYLTKPAPLLMVLYRDAFWGNTCIFVLAVVGGLLARADAPSYFWPYLIGFSCYFMIPCKIILNLREVTSDIDGWDLTTVPVPTTGRTTSSESSNWDVSLSQA
ncbi:hypothetical protein CALCODRAFT_286079 [Calocera cornea HHB12733]|uniref:DUF6533 domain-containing protein n=1 Tax=Calocera cornea HHB12733 TaxID=1353952 RepID=A0A165FWU6_9BASI|nr:hypothetical protein CALCODRAFT_286079 [Calocera cornea HHB12733]